MTIRQLAGAVALMLGAAAGAQAADVYATGAFGASRMHVNDYPGITMDKSDTGFKLGAGMQILPTLGVEAGYADLGKTKLSGAGGSGSIKANGLYVDVLGTALQQGDFSLYGRLGVFNGKVKGEASGLTGTATGKSSSTKVKYGLGVGYAIDKNMQLRGEWERYRLNVGGVKGDVDLLSLGLTIGF